MIRLIFFFVVLFLVGTSATAQWNYLGLKNNKVNSLVTYGDNIYAATDKGLFAKNIVDSDTNWNSIGFVNQQVNAIIVRGNNEIFAGIKISGVGSDTITLFKTINGGAMWSPLWGEYDPSQLGYVYIDNMKQISTNSDTIIVNAGGIRKSVNGGITFVKTNIQGGRFLAVAPNNPNILWTGGETPILMAYLIQTIDGGNTWFNTDSIQQITAGDNACLSADIHPSNSEIVYVGMENRIAKSVDNGLNWTNLGHITDYTKGIKISPSNPSTIYATGGSWGDTDIHLFVSNDEGSNWDTLTYAIGSATDTDPLAIAVMEDGSSDIIFIGTQNNGVFQFQNIPLSIDNTQKIIEINIYPNPTCRYLILDYPINKIGTLNIFNFNGQKIYTCTKISSNQINVSNLESGIFFIEIQADEGVILNKFIKQ